MLFNAGKMLVKLKLSIIVLLILINNFCLSSSENESGDYLLPKNAEVLYAVDIFRHGARTPIHNLAGVEYPKLWNTRNIPNKNLTFNGFFQAQRLGVNAREFFTKYSVLPNIHELDKVYIRTSGANRTIMSAAGYLSGLFDATKSSYPSIQPFNIYSVPLREDDVLRQNNQLPDLRYKDAIGWKKYWFDVARKDYKKLFGINKTFFPDNYEAQCLNPIDISPGEAYFCLKRIFDLANNVLSIEDYCNAMPKHESCLDSMTGLNDEDVFKIKKHYNWIQTRSRVLYHEPQDYEFIKYLDAYKYNAKNVASNLMKEILSRFESIQLNADVPKISVYSSHDITISNFISYIINFNLGQYKNNPPYNEYPSYSANIRVVFYKDQDVVYVTVLYYPNILISKPVVLYGRLDQNVIIGLPYDEFNKIYSDPNE